MSSYSRVHLALFFIISFALAQTWATDTSPSGGSGSGPGFFFDPLDFDFDVIDDFFTSPGSLPAPLDHDFDQYESDKINELLDEYGFKSAIKNSEQIVFGPEFTFWVPAVDEFGNPKEDGSGEDYPLDNVGQVARIMEKILINDKVHSEKFISSSTFGEVWAVDFISPDKWHFNLKPDPGVIEVTMAPLTVEKYEQHKDKMQESIFDIMKQEAGYSPSDYGGGGHISISTAYFKKRPLLFRNFIVDLINHGELFLGVFGFDTNNALSPLMVQQHEWDEVVKELELLDRFRTDSSTIEEFFIHYAEVMHRSSDPYLQFWRPIYYEEDGATVPRGKYHAIEFKRNFVTLDSGHTIATGVGDRIEIRAVRAQASADVWVRQIRLLRNRIKYLEKLNKPIPLKPLFDIERLDKISNHDLKDLALNIPIDPQDALKAFHQYVTEAGEKWEDHQDYVWPQWISDGEVEKFNGTLCNSLLEI